jgi:glycosyltransferase involved in cell wall biosynthesis
VAKLDLGRGVEFVGFTKDIPSALGELDAMVLPSLYGEGLPMVVLEAMAAGLPVVATRVEGTPEAVRHGCEGLLAEPNNVDSLAAALFDLISGKYNWQRLSHAAVQRHAEVFSAESMARGTAAVYRRVIG